MLSALSVDSLESALGAEFFILDITNKKLYNITRVGDNVTQIEEYNVTLSGETVTAKTLVGTMYYSFDICQKSTLTEWILETFLLHFSKELLEQLLHK